MRVATRLLRSLDPVDVERDADGEIDASVAGGAGRTSRRKDDAVEGGLGMGPDFRHDSDEVVEFDADSVSGQAEPEAERDGDDMEIDEAIERKRRVIKEFVEGRAIGTNNQRGASAFRKFNFNLRKGVAVGERGKAT